MASINTGVSAGSPSVSDEQGGGSSSSQESSSEPVDFLSGMLTRAGELGASSSGDEPPGEGSAADDGKADSKAKDAPPKGDAKAEAGEKDPNAKKPDGDDAKGEKKPAPEGFVPRAAFERRVSELTSQRRELRAEASSLKLENAKLKAALGITVDEAKHYRGVLEGGSKFDEKDDQLRKHEVLERARKETERVQHEHEAALAESSEEEAVEEVRLKLEDELAEALDKNDLIGRPELVAAVQAPENRARSIAQVAAVLQQKREAAARKRFGVPEGTATTATGAKPSDGKAPAMKEERPAWPKTARAKANGNAGRRQEATLEDMLKRAEELEAAG